jgi:hypothetical protein
MEDIAADPLEMSSGENGRFPQIIPVDDEMLDEPFNDPVSVTSRPTFVYLPLELNVPTTVNAAPWLGVHVPSS